MGNQMEVTERIASLTWDRTVTPNADQFKKALSLRLEYGAEGETSPFGVEVWRQTAGALDVSVDLKTLKEYKDFTGKDIHTFEDEFIRELYLFVAWMREKGMM